MKFRTALALSFALWAVPAVAFADAKLEGTWSLDVPATVKLMTAKQPLPPDQLKAMTDEMGKMSQQFSLTFVGQQLQANTGEDVTKCDWSWGEDDEVVTKNCLNSKGKPNDLEPEREAIQLKGSALHLINKAEDNAIVFRRK
jgi:hypothetical protein